MSFSPIPTTNAQHSLSRRFDTQPDRSAQFNNTGSYNFALTKSREYDRYTPAISSKLNVVDQSRIVEPMIVYGTRLIQWNGQRPLFSPSGMYKDATTKITGLAFTKPVKKMYAQNA